MPRSRAGGRSHRARAGSAGAANRGPAQGAGPAPALGGLAGGGPALRRGSSRYYIFKKLQRSDLFLFI